MLTNNVYDINVTNDVETLFASAVYTRMAEKRYGIKSCKRKIRGAKVYVDYELLNLSKLIEDDCPPCKPKNQCLLDIPKCCRCEDLRNKDND